MADKRTARQLVDSMIVGGSPATRAKIHGVLDRAPLQALRVAADAHTRIRTLGRAERYDDASPALKRLGVDVDAWPAPPAGLFVVEERTLYLRSVSDMTIAHEFGHAVDCALGNGIYTSSTDPELRAAFNEAKGHVTPYASTGLDEWFAEGFRSLLGVNDVHSHWPKVSPERLQSLSPKLYSFFDRTFGEKAIAIERESAAPELQPAAVAAVAEAERPEAFEHSDAGERAPSSNEKRNEYYRELTNDLITVLESGSAKNVSDQLWRVTRNGIPFNPTTEQAYRGGNVLRLLVTSVRRGWSDPRFMTVKQANKKGWSVRAGERGTHIEVWKFRDRYRDENGNVLTGKALDDALADPARKEKLDLERHGICRFYTVFNASQIDAKLEIDGEIVKKPLIEVEPLIKEQRSWELHERAERIVEALGVPVHHDGGNEAYYLPSRDDIHLPLREAFPSADNYYDTLMHEAGHSTGHEKRLNRPMLKEYSKDRKQRAREELRAELTSFFMAAELGLPHNIERHADYIGSWAQLLRDNHMEIFDASRDAQAAHDFLLARERELLQQREQEQTQEHGETRELAGVSALLSERQKMNGTVARDVRATWDHWIGGVIRMPEAWRDDARMVEISRQDMLKSMRRSIEIVSERLGIDIVVPGLEDATRELAQMVVNGKRDHEIVKRSMELRDSLLPAGLQQAFSPLAVDGERAAVLQAFDRFAASVERAVSEDPERLTHVARILATARRDLYVIVDHGQTESKYDVSRFRDYARNAIQEINGYDLNGSVRATGEALYRSLDEHCDALGVGREPVLPAAWAIYNELRGGGPPTALEAFKDVENGVIRACVNENARAVAQLRLGTIRDMLYALQYDGRALDPERAAQYQQDIRGVLQRTIEGEGVAPSPHTHEAGVVFLQRLEALVAGRGDTVEHTAERAYVLSHEIDTDDLEREDVMLLAEVHFALSHMEGSPGMLALAATEAGNDLSGELAKYHNTPDAIQQRERDAAHFRQTQEKLDALERSGVVALRVSSSVAIDTAIEQAFTERARDVGLNREEFAKAPAFSALIEDRFERFMERVREAGHDRNKVWSVCMNEIKALKAAYEITTVRRMLTTLRAAVREADPQHPAIEFLRASTSDTREINAQTRANVAERLKDLRAIDPEHIADAAELLLRSDAFPSLVAGVILATGRGLPEVSHGDFTPIGETYLHFSGVVRGRQKDLTIPSLVESDLVLKAIAQLREMKPVADMDVKALNGSYSKPVAAAMRLALGPDYQDVSLEDARALYATVAHEWHGSPTTSIVAYHAEVLGHSPDVVTSALGKIKFFPVGKELETCERLEHARLELISRVSHRLTNPDLSPNARAALQQDLQELRAVTFDMRPPAQTVERPQGVSPLQIGQSRDGAGAADRSAPSLAPSLQNKENTMPNRGILIGYPGKANLLDNERGQLLKLGLKQTFGRGDDRREKWYDISARDDVAVKLNAALQDLKKGQMLKVDVNLERGSYKGRDEHWHDTVELPVQSFEVVDKLEKGQKINNFELVGKVMDEPKLENLPSGDVATNVRLEVPALKRGKEDQLRVRLFGDDARKFVSDVKKGQEIPVTGRLQISQYEDKDKAVQRRPELVLTSFGDGVAQSKDNAPQRAPEQTQTAAPANGVDKTPLQQQPHRVIPEQSLLVEFARENGEVVASREVTIVRRENLPYNLTGKIVAESLDGQKIYQELGKGDVLELDKAAFEGRLPEVGDRVELRHGDDGKETAIFKDEQRAQTREREQSKDRDRDEGRELAAS